MTLLILSIIVRKLLILVNNTYLWFRQRFSADRRSELSLRFLHLTLVVLMAITLLFIIPSIIFTCMEENWSFIDAFYFCFISLTTIGLGDFVAGDSPSQRHRLAYKICLTGRRSWSSTSMHEGFTVFSLPSGGCDNHDAHRGSLLSDA